MIEKDLIKLMKILLPKGRFVHIRKLWRKTLRLGQIEKNQQNLFLQNYNSMIKNKNQKAILCNHEFKVYSQNGEDGILLHIFSKIGVTNCRFVEIGIEDGRECNTSNLSINFDWNGLLIEGNRNNVISAKEYYEKMLKDKQSKVKIVQCFVTKKNINKVLLENGVRDDIDLLSIDIDGNDYWIWEEINVIKPRVVVIEYNSSFGDKSITTEYDPSFGRFKKHSSSFYYGASLSALTKLAKSKGYILVGCDSTGCNAFFVQEVAKKKLSEIPIKEAYYPDSRKEGSTSEQFEQIKHLNFEEV